MILGAVFACALVYLAPLMYADEDHAGIWKVPNREWMRHDGPQTSPPERVCLTGLMSRHGPIRGLLWFVGVALYFSFLSALAIGRQDLQATVWITRIQPGEYSLRPTGWVRSLSGIQALASVVFVALAAGSYLGRLLD